ncbi:protein ALP1-like [Ixodes scapularis]|uniref:protein ALP1-like n=1 Tax=Ixodes scapularis TaxID=6945 RepID=UPI001C391F38|nr:protein ALP1-like [Ixodes scapularis]
MAFCPEKRAVVAALLLFEALSSSEDEELPTKRRMWVKPYLRRHREQGCYANLMRELALEDAEAFRSWIRMDTGTFEELLRKVRPLIEKQDTSFREAIPAGERLAITLRYLATGETFASMGFQFRRGHNTISKIVRDVCVAIYEVLAPDYIKVPSTPGEWEQVARGFEEIWQFPHCLGALDGKHVTICPPQGTGAMYRNYKGTFSIVLMALVDSDLKFLYADVGRNGRMNDSGVWAATDLRARIDRGIAEFPKAAQLPNSTKTAPFVIVGDEGFGMKPYLMRPFPASELEDAERIFNYRLSRGRRIVENGFGILRNRFQVYGAPLRHKPDRAVKVVKATIALHNYLRTKNGTRARYTPPDSLDVEDVLTVAVRQGSWRKGVNDKAVFPLERIGGRQPDDAKAVREVFRDYFMNEGQVSWQWKVLE